MRIYFAPMEGITGYRFRKIFETYYGGVDKYFAPFISPADNCAMNPKEKRDVLPENNVGITLVPQILTCKEKHFKDAADMLIDMGYGEINLNLGCPSGTVCAKGKGAGFLADKDKLNRFLDDVYTYAERKNIALSLKTRLGFYAPEEFYDLLEIFNAYPVKELIIHPRVRSDYYNGLPRYEYFFYAIRHGRHPLVYNGNIFRTEDYHAFCDRMKREISDADACTTEQQTECVMLGRGLIANPELAQLLRRDEKNGTACADGFDYKRFWSFHDDIYDGYKEVLSPDIVVLHRMKELWTYWKALFPDAERNLRKLLKAKRFADYESVLRQLGR